MQTYRHLTPETRRLPTPPPPSPVLVPGSRRRCRDTSATETDGSGGSRDGDDTGLSTGWLSRLLTNHNIQSTARQTTTGRQPTPALMIQVPPAPPPCQASLSHLSHSRFTFLVEPTPALVREPRSSLSLVLPVLTRTSCIQHCSLATPWPPFPSTNEPESKSSWQSSQTLQGSATATGPSLRYP